MLLPARPRPKLLFACLTYRHAGALLLAAGACALPEIVLAQTDTAPVEEPAPVLAEGERVAFESDGLSYDSDNDLVTAFGNVLMKQGDQSVRADKVTWDRKSGRIAAEGNIRFVDRDGNQLFTDSLELDDEFRAGAMSNMLIALREGGRLAANKGERGMDGNVILSEAVYSACAVEDSEGCPRKPSWRISAERVIFDPVKKLVRFKGARLELFGARLMPLPGLVLATDGRPINGFLIPDIRLSASNGVELSTTWYQRLADNRDLSITGYVYTEALPMISAQYRALTSKGAYQVTGYATRSSRIPIGTAGTSTRQDWRGYLASNGRFQFDPYWSLT